MINLFLCQIDNKIGIEATQGINNFYRIRFYCNKNKLKIPSRKEELENICEM